MKKIFFCILFCFIAFNSYAIDPEARRIQTNVSNFNHNLSSADNNVQKALDTLDDLVAGSTMVYPGSGIALSTGSAWGSSIANNSANWNTAYGWGNHALAGYLTSESDPTYSASSWFSTTNNHMNWDTAYTNAGHVSDATHNGYLSASDWSIFNGKQGAITTGTTAQYFRGDLSLATFPTLLSQFTNDLGNYGGFLTNISGQDLSTADNSVSEFITLGDVPAPTWVAIGGTQSSVNLSGFTNDAGFITSSALSAYQPLITTGTTAQYFRGDLSLATFPTVVSAFTNDAGYLTAETDPVFTAWLGNRKLYNSGEVLAYDWNLGEFYGDDGASVALKIDASANGIRLPQLTSNGLLRTSGGDGTVIEDNTAYLTAANGELLDGSNQPSTGNKNIQKATPVLTLTDTGDTATAFWDKTATNNRVRHVSQNRPYASGKALSMVGTGYSSRAAVTLGTVYTVEFWYKTTSTASQMPIGGSTTGQHIIFWFSGATTVSARTDTGVQVDWTGVTYADGVKHHWLMTVNGTGLELFKDNASLGTKTSASTISRAYTNIGSYGDTNHVCNGILDEVVIWNKVLNSTERAARYNSGAGAVLSSYTNVVAEYRFDSNYNDSSPNAYTLSAGGTGNTFVTGFVAASVQAVSNLTYLQVNNDATNLSLGTVQLGDYSSTYGTVNKFEGTAYQFNRLGSELGYWDATHFILGSSGLGAKSNIVSVGFGNVTSMANSVNLGKSNTINDSTGIGDGSVTVGRDLTVDLQRSVAVGLNGSATGGSCFSAGYGVTTSGNNSAVVGINVANTTANIWKGGLSSTTYFSQNSSGLFSNVISGTTNFSSDATGIVVNGTSPTITMQRGGVAKSTFNVSTLDNIKWAASSGGANIGMDTGGRTYIGSGGTTTAALFLQNVSATTDKVLLLKHIASGSGTFIDAWDSANNSKFSVDSSGNITTVGGVVNFVNSNQQISGAGSVLTVTTNGFNFARFGSTGFGIGGELSTAASLGVQNTGATTTRVTALFKAVASQTAALTDWQNSAGTSFQRVLGGGGQIIGDVANYLDNSAWLGIKNIGTTTIPLFIRLAASQTANAISVASSAASANVADLFSVSSAGKVTINADGTAFLQGNDAGLAHGMTGIVPTSVFYSAEEYADNSGGTIIRALTGDVDQTALFFVGINGKTSGAPTTPPIVFRGGQKSGTNYGAIASGANPVISFDNYTTRLLTLYSNGNAALAATALYPTIAKLEVNAAGTGLVYAVNTSASGASAGGLYYGISDDGAAMASGDRVGGIIFTGSQDASHNLGNGAGIFGVTTETWSGTANGEKLEFYTTPNTTATRALALTIDQDKKATFAGTVKAAGYQSSDGSAGITATIVTAQLTALGSQGSMTFKDGILTAQTAAT